VSPFAAALIAVCIVGKSAGTFIVVAKPTTVAVKRKKLRVRNMIRWERECNRTFAPRN
jgi:hypothetical protein